jgi:hypothetical protein
LGLSCSKLLKAASMTYTLSKANAPLAEMPELSAAPGYFWDRRYSTFFSDVNDEDLK